MRIEPAPSEPIAPATSPAATAAAAPPLEPPGVWSRCQGLRVAPKASVSEKCHWPTSGALVLPTTIAPGRAQAADRLGVALGHAVLAGAAERGDVAGEVDVVLDRHRHPEQGARSPAARRRSACSASARACSAQTTRKALRLGLRRLDPGQRALGQLAGADLARGEGVRLGDQPVQLPRRRRCSCGRHGDAGAAVGDERDGAAAGALAGARARAGARPHRGSPAGRPASRTGRSWRRGSGGCRRRRGSTRRSRPGARGSARDGRPRGLDRGPRAGAGGRSRG